jgi:predicted ATPase with chaperone activity
VARAPVSRLLDELPEVRRDVLEDLRQPLEEHGVMVVRARWRVTYPARVMLVGAMNPCPCGFGGDPTRTCGCTPRQLGPVADRRAPARRPARQSAFALSCSSVFRSVEP